MRKIIVTEFVSLDGVIQAPGGPQEDPSGGFAYGGWIPPYADAVSGKLMQQQMQSTDLLLGRKTFQNFESYWPAHAQFWPGINEVTKYVVSSTLNSSSWINCIFLKDLAALKSLKASTGPDLKVWGSSELVHLLLEHDLVDELWLKIYPIILGKGKKLYDEHAVPAAFTLTETTVTPKGIIFATYQRAGQVQTGSF
jgi:dihydrofolate reductase